MVLGETASFLFWPPVRVCLGGPLAPAFFIEDSIALETQASRAGQLDP